MSLKREYDADFEYFFWTVYPKKVGKPAAEKEFLRLKFTDDQKRELREHIEIRCKRDKKWLPHEKTGSTFIPDPERFLKHRRFEDEYETVYVKPRFTPKPEAPEVPVWQAKGFPSPDAYRAHVDRVAAEHLAKLRVQH